MSVEAIHEQLLSEARAEARRLVADAAERGRRSVAEARREAARRLDDARRDGLAAADRHAARDLAEARRAAREVVLAAQREAWVALGDAARAAVGDLRHADGYAALVDRLATMARRQLGPDAVITRDPGGRGGLAARSGTRSVDLTLDALAGVAVGRLGPRVRELWR